MRFELCENSDQKVTSRADEIRVEDHNPRTTPYDGREVMLLRLSKKVKSSANSEDESEDEQTSVWHHIAKEVHLA